ncbi:MAG: phosphotransferase [Desulfobacterales bacterium]|nr:phosphotransferase [Desulfobacterales bacterium]
MKTLILAAGYGTRLLPYTNYTPKPLFTIAGRPILHRLIDQLYESGCHEIILNVHHLHEKIQSYIQSQSFPIPVHLSHEPEILGTGGAIQQVFSFWDEHPFMVINGDVFTNINFKTVYDFHLSHNDPVTLVLVNDPKLNTVGIDRDGNVVSFYGNSPEAKHRIKNAVQWLTFTGIHVIDPTILDYIPKHSFSHIIDVYNTLIQKGFTIRTLTIHDQLWIDIGTPETYQLAARHVMTEQALTIAFGASVFQDQKPADISCEKLQGDGSDRQWFRIDLANKSLILAAHGIRTQDKTCEVDAYIDIGNHLFHKGIPVPKIFNFDRFSGMVYLEYLGNLHLQTLIQAQSSESEMSRYYQQVIDVLIDFSVLGYEGFNPDWTFQTPAYNHEVIIDRECHYFINAFVNGYLGMNIHPDMFKKEFHIIAERVLSHGTTGLMHRDFQSRNLLMKDDRVFVIDFQSARIGPIEYDLASLLIDPYVCLSLECQHALKEYGYEKLSTRRSVQKQEFDTAYMYCALTRNLQILGAFGFLSQVKGKLQFLSYIPAALKTLKNHVQHIQDHELSLFFKFILTLNDKPKVG